MSQNYRFLYPYHHSCIQVQQLNSESGRILNTFKSIKQASDMLNLSSSGISRACNNILETSGGFRWRKIPKKLYSLE